MDHDKIRLEGGVSRGRSAAPLGKEEKKKKFPGKTSCIKSEKKRLDNIGASLHHESLERLEEAQGRDSRC